MGWLAGKLEPKARLQSRMPLARTDQLIVEELADELLIYDQTSHRAHCLSSSAGRVWRACDGTSTAAQLSRALDLDRGTVTRALVELETSGLLDTGPPVARGSTRREATVRLAKIGAAAASAPLIWSMAVPAPALASSQAFCLALGCVQDCGQCHQASCSCCGPGNKTTTADKICTADCGPVECNDALRAAHCGTISPSSACN